jgi:hypothetical protein
MIASPRYVVCCRSPYVRKVNLMVPPLPSRVNGKVCGVALPEDADDAGMLCCINYIITGNVRSQG